MKKILLYPSNHLTTVIPIALILGFAAGLALDTSFFKNYILLITFIMIFPTMIGFKLKEAVDLSHMKTLLLSLGINFAVIPVIAYWIGITFLGSEPAMLAGLIMISLFPTSGMTISWTMLSKGNVPAAIKITAVSLLLGSFLAPWYLYVLAGKFVDIDPVQTLFTILQIVVLPMVLGNLTYRLLMRKYTPQQFNQEVKPYLPAVSTWAMLAIVFASISMRASVILSNPAILAKLLLILVAFYLINFSLSTWVARKTLRPEDGFALLYGTVMRNLSVALGIAVASFGPETALIITLAFIIQVQGAAWYGKLAPKYKWLQGGGSSEKKRNPAAG